MRARFLEGLGYGDNDKEFGIWSCCDTIGFFEVRHFPRSTDGLLQLTRFRLCNDVIGHATLFTFLIYYNSGGVSGLLNRRFSVNSMATTSDRVLSFTLCLRRELRSIKGSRRSQLTWGNPLQFESSV